MFVPHGVNAAMLTPFDKDGKVNEAVVRDLVDFLIEKGVNGLLPVASIGEFIHISLEEQMRVMDVVVEQAAGRVAVFPGAMAAATDNAIKLAKHAEKIGCQAVVVLPPYYSAISQDLIRKHFEKIARSVNIGLILYNIPSCTTPLSLDTVEQLLSIRNIVGIKDSSGSMVNLMHLVSLAQEKGRDKDFNVLTGWDDTLYAALSVGVAGVIGGATSILPEVTVAIYKEFQAGNKDKALELQRQLLPILRTMISLQFPHGFKTALELRGFDIGPLRQPIEEVDKYRFLTFKKQLGDQMNKLLGGNLVVHQKRIPGLY